MRRDPLFAVSALLAALTSGALGMTGEVTVLALVVPLVAAFAWLRPRTRPLPLLAERAFSVAAIAFLGWFLLNLAQARMLAGAAALTIPVHVHSLLQPRTLLAVRRLQLVSFFQLVALAASTTQVLFGPLLAAHLLLVPIALTLEALERAQGEPRRPVQVPRRFVGAAALAAAACLVGGALVFLALPRYEAGLMRNLAAPPQRVSGFSETVTLGDITRIRTSSAIVMRVRLRGEAEGEALRWRGITLDRFTGREWTKTGDATPVGGRGRRQLAAPGPAPRLVEQEITIEPMSSRALFHLPRAVAIEPANFTTVRRDAWGNVTRGGDSSRRPRYVVVSDRGPDAALLDELARARTLQLPPLDPRVAELARGIAGEGSDLERARRLEQALQEQWPYTLAVEDVGVDRPVERFLLERSAGHCEYFATGHAIMLRTLGIPSRVVNGFQAGSWSKLFNCWVVRQRDAHSWVEAWIPGAGWTTFDPTPAVGRLAPAEETGEILELWRRTEMFWDDNVIGFSAASQIGVLITIREQLERAQGALARVPWRRVAWVGAALAMALALALAARAARRVRRRRRSGVAFHAEAERLLARRGWIRREGQTPAELARQVAAEAPGGPAAALEELTRRYYDARFGRLPADAARVRELLAALRELPARGRNAAPGTGRAA